MDVRREVQHIYKEFDRYQNKIGEAVIWFEYDMMSTYDTVYDEANRNYLPGKALQILWVDQQEDPENYAAEGRRPTQRIRFAVSSRSLNETGIGATEAHGGRLWDLKPYGKPWWDDRLNDIIYYDGRWYAISDFQIRGRARQDVVVGVAGIEIQPMDETMWDLFPRDPQPDYDPRAALQPNGQPYLDVDGYTPLLSPPSSGPHLTLVTPSTAVQATHVVLDVRGTGLEEAGTLYVQGIAGSPQTFIDSTHMTWEGTVPTLGEPVGQVDVAYLAADGITEAHPPLHLTITET